jgi:hypothetical protein
MRRAPVPPPVDDDDEELDDGASASEDSDAGGAADEQQDVVAAEVPHLSALSAAELTDTFLVDGKNYEVRVYNIPLLT